MTIRKIAPSDNSKIERIIKASLIEFGLPTVGTAFEDKETLSMYDAYQNEREVYFILEIDGEILGGGGIQQLKGSDTSICELQKMYFDPKIRGKGYGQLFFDTCMQAARDFNYQQCYLESASALKAAIHIYKKNDFKHLDNALGETGHYSCSVWMLKNL
jgi:putative acetyltransferase